MSGLESLFPNLAADADPLALRLVLGLLIAFIIGQMNAWCYIWTHRGVSYSRTFTHALVLISVIAALSMSLVSANIVAAFGLIGGLAIIRFRTAVRDARDTAFVLLCLVCGLAVGFGFYAAAVIGAAVINLISFYLYGTGFGSRHASDSLLRFQVDTAALQGPAFGEILDRYCRRHTVVSVDEAPPLSPTGRERCQLAYKVRLRDPNLAGELVEALKKGCGINAVQLLVEQENEEVA